MDRVDILGVRISAVNFESSIKYLFDNFDEAKGKYICAANVHTTVTAHDDLEYRRVQNNSFLTLPDGKPLSVVGKKGGYTDMGRVTGPDFMEEILKRTENSSFTHFFYGNTKENLKIFIDEIQKQYPNLKIVGFEHSAFRELSDEETNQLINKINLSKADFVWVALGAPRQEFFCEKLSKRTNSIWVAVGGAFNVISGVIPRAPKWMQNVGLEWLYRLLKEPKRLFKRYFITNTKFLYYLAKEKS